MDEQTVGKELFGRWIRLAVARWALHQDPHFFQKQAITAMDYSSSAVSQELDRLVRLGMLERFDRPSDRRVYYRKTESPLWDAIRVVDKSLSNDAAAGASEASA